MKSQPKSVSACLVFDHVPMCNVASLQPPWQSAYDMSYIGMFCPIHLPPNSVAELAAALCPRPAEGVENQVKEMCGECHLCPNIESASDVFVKPLHSTVSNIAADPTGDVVVKSFDVIHDGCMLVLGTVCEVVSCKTCKIESNPFL